MDKEEGDEPLFRSSSDPLGGQGQLSAHIRFERMLPGWGRGLVVFKGGRKSRHTHTHTYIYIHTQPTAP